MIRSARALGLALACGLALGALIHARPALADCVTVGTTTTCSGTSGGGAVGVSLTGGNNTVVNLGTLSGTVVGVLLSGSTNTVLNNGAITGGQGILFFDIDGSDNNTATNNGTITVTALGIGAIGDNNTLVNNGTITATQGTGILVDGQNNLVINNGTIIGLASDSSVVSTGVGIVINNGTLDGRVQVEGTLTNNGLITISAPGAGVQHEAGIFQQSATGILRLRADAAGARDSLAVDGVATLGGGLQLSLQPGLYADTTTYAGVVTAGDLGGTQFATVPAPSPFFSVSVAYQRIISASQVDVTLTRIPFGSVTGLTENQRAIGTALEGQYGTTLTGAPATFYGNLLTATSVDVLDSLSGEIATAVQNPSFALGTQFLDAMLGQLRRRRDSQCGTPSGQGGGGRPGRWGAWIAGIGVGGHRDGDAEVGSARANATSGGGVAGIDVCVAPSLVVGIAVGGAATDFSLDGRAANGTARSGFVGTYGSWSRGPLYVDLGLAYLRSEYSTTRTVSVNTLNEVATGEFAGNQFASRIEAGWRFQVGGYELTPFIGLSGQVLHQNGFDESATNTATGQPGILGLSYRGATTDAPLPVVGGQAATTFNYRELVTVTPRLRLSWGHETSTKRSATSSFQSMPGASFTVNGARAARNALNVRAGVDVEIAGILELYAQFDGALASGGSGLAGSAGLRMAW